MRGKIWNRQNEIMMRVAAACALCLLFSLSARAQDNDAPKQTGVSIEADPAAAMLETGFHQLYELNFQGAREQFLAYQKLRPEDPLGKAAEAASYLVRRIQRQGRVHLRVFPERLEAPQWRRWKGGREP